MSPLKRLERATLGFSSPVGNHAARLSIEHWPDAVALCLRVRDGSDLAMATDYLRAASRTWPRARSIARRLAVADTCKAIAVDVLEWRLSEVELLIMREYRADRTPAP